MTKPNFDKLWKKSKEICALLIDKRHLKEVPLRILSVRESTCNLKNTKCRIGMKADFGRKIGKLLVMWNPDYPKDRVETLGHEITHVAIWLHHEGFPEEVICEAAGILFDKYLAKIQSEEKGDK
jgi:hypothetical protein